MADTPKNSNVTIVAIAFAIVIIVAMVCGMVMWIMQRTMAMNEKYIDARIAEAQLRAQTIPQPVPSTPLQVAPAPVVQPTVQPTATAQPMTNVQPTSDVKAVTPPEPKAELKKPEVKDPPKAKSVTKRIKKVARPKSSEPTKREAPVETSAAVERVGEDGQPKDRINLSVGNDDLDWQL